MLGNSAIGSYDCIFGILAALALAHGEHSQYTLRAALSVSVVGAMDTVLVPINLARIGVSYSSNQPHYPSTKL